MRILLILISFLSLAHAEELQKTQILLNWVPEPEFGGFYAAKERGIYKRFGLDVELVEGGAGAPTIQLAAAQKVPFAIASGGEVVTARSRRAKVKAVLSVYEKSPLIIMAHKSRGLKSMADVFKSGTLAVEQGHAFVAFLKEKYSFAGVKLVPYAGGVAAFLNDKNFSQQGFIFSEPILARNQGADVQVFLVADSGYNPYMEVLVVHDEFLESNRALVKKVVEASREGWLSYMNDPEPINEVMAKLNKSMDLKTFHEGSRAQLPLLHAPNSKPKDFGKMSVQRFQTMIDQLSALQSIITKPEAKDCFENF